MRMETVCGGACEDDEDKHEDVEDEGGEPSRPRLFRPLQYKKGTVNMVAKYQIKQNIMTNRKALVFQFARRNGINCTMKLNYWSEANTAL
jgi:hypothetical protein